MAKAQVSMMEQLIQRYEDELQEVEKELREVSIRKEQARSFGDMSENAEYSTACADEKSLEQERSRIEGMISALQQNVDPIVVKLSVPDCGVPELEEGCKWLLHPTIGQVPTGTEYGILSKTSTIVGKIIGGLHIQCISENKIRVVQNKHYNEVTLPYSINYTDKNNKLRKLIIMGVEELGNQNTDEEHRA